MRTGRCCLSKIYEPLTSGSYYEQPAAMTASALRLSRRRCCSPPPRCGDYQACVNAFLALKISFINAVSNLCEAANADVEQVAKAWDGQPHRT
jgi:UDPglucose 6-dehydrogenase